ncbi:Oligosaccharyl transferase STT3 subunit-domain-containing protein [Rhodocollybia butyracea]|uniref:dolichyl-diphosphooligosaccharide--protein glycotransferase n=1 Tax=Rhodocollybia butyracea TaxID=206335 RepID=A0A9P5P6N2_9AGAR|nr:Oligosaccharyl transferase STT3 subunit-domain-containing protein [Rhodocollybia butyracea]
MSTVFSNNVSLTTVASAASLLRIVAFGLDSVYLGLMATGTSSVIYNFLHYFNLLVDIQNTCVLLAPGFSALTACATYMFTTEMKDSSAGLLAAAFIGIVPGYISRSVAGSYDNEAIAFLLLMTIFYLRILMVAIGASSSMQVPFVGFQPVRTPEHMGSLGVFGLLQIVAFASLVRSDLSSKQFQDLSPVSVITMGLLGAGVFIVMTYKGWIAPWTGWFYSLWDTGLREKSSCVSDEHIFVIIYTVVALYFAGLMVCLMLTLTPVVCASAAVVLSTLLDIYADVAGPAVPENERNGDSSANGRTRIWGADARHVIILNAIGMLVYFVFHRTWVIANAYASPSVHYLIDDYWEAYYWLRMNTPQDVVVMCRWDYGMSVDNNTWNNSKFLCFLYLPTDLIEPLSSPEEIAYPILRQHNVDYAFIFSSLLGYSGDDINKFFWMAGIGQGVSPDVIQELNYLTLTGEYRVDDRASDAMKNSLMSKMSYYRYPFGFFGVWRAFTVDRVRNQNIPKIGPTLDYVEEAFTSENWIVQIFKGKKRKRSKPVSIQRDGPTYKRNRSP